MLLDALLIIATIVLGFALFMISKSHKRRIKEIEDYQKQNESRERKLFNLYQNLEESMEVFEDYAEKVKKDIDNEKAEIIELTGHIMRRHFTAPPINMRELRGGEVEPSETVRKFAAPPPEHGELDDGAVRHDQRFARDPSKLSAVSAEAVKLASAVQQSPARQATAVQPQTVSGPVAAAQNAIDAAAAAQLAPQPMQQPRPTAQLAPQPMPAAMRPMTPMRGQGGAADILSIRAAAQEIRGKPQRVRYMLERGLTVDQVAKELDIGKGEVKLIAGLRLDD